MLQKQLDLNKNTIFKIKILIFLYKSQKNDEKISLYLSN